MRMMITMMWEAIRAIQSLSLSAPIAAAHDEVRGRGVNCPPPGTPWALSRPR
jgi:hypothetical protein